MKYCLSVLLLVISGGIFCQQTNTLTQVPISNQNSGTFVGQQAIQIDPLSNNPIKTPIDNLGGSSYYGQPTIISTGTFNNNSSQTNTGQGNNGPIIQFGGNQSFTTNGGAQADPRNLPLSPNGKLLSVDGYEVDFKVHPTSKTSDVCSTPIPSMLDGSKDPACGFIVPRDNPASRDAANTAVTKYFQLRWLVFTDGGPSSNIDQARINDLMAELNADYAAHNMVFCADPATFLESPTWFTHNSNTDEFPMKDANNVNPTQVINIYVVGSMSAGGYARMPYDPNGGPSPRGGIVMNKGNCTVGTHTLAHEMGHTFGLFHTFNGVSEQGACSNCYEKVRNANGSSNTSGVPTPLGGPYTQEGDQEGDWCSDTNPHAQDSYQCPGPAGSEACDAFPRVPANYPIDNHMSYSFCTSIFTAQQSRRMHGMAEDYLTSWTAYGGGICGTQPPVADFVGTPTTWVAPNNVTFTDLSTPQNIITGWTWTFDVAGGNGVTCAGCVGPNATFTGQVPPVVTYPNVGCYDVSLTITSANGPDTETKTGYICVVGSGSDCDTLDADWNTPAPNVTIISGVNGYFTGCPNEGSTAPADPAGFYQQYFTPNPGSSVVGAVTVGLGLLNDPNDNMTFQVSVYEDDAGNPGFPDIGAGPIAVRAFSPTQIGVPTGANYNVFNIPFLCAPTVAGGTFHVGVEIFPGDATDELIVVSNSDGEGGSPLTNTYVSTACGSQDFNDVGTGSIFCASYLPVDFDLYCYPQMGWYRPTGQALGYTEDVQCDSTVVEIATNTLYDGAGCTAPSAPNPGMVGWTYVFADGTTISSPTEVSTLNRTYYTAGPDTLTIMVSNDCGRADTTVWIIPYNFMSTPDAEFTKVQANPICMGAPGVDFNANTSGYQDYLWDFGDGTTASSGNSSTTNHVYTAPGLYYTSLTVTSLGYQPVDTFYLEDFEGGWPAGYDRYNNDAFTPNAGVNPPFTGSNATAWLPMDIDGDGDVESVSTSWHTAAGQQADDWMITAAIGPLPANQMLTWDGQALDATFSDGYEVRISNTQLPANVGNYGAVLTTVAAENAFSTSRSADLSNYAGQTVYIAFRNNSVDQFLLSIDNIRIGTIGAGCSATITKLDFVEIVDCSVSPPVAELYASDSLACAPATIIFADSTTVGDPATSWLWNFGDGQFSTVQNPPAHSYATPGTYFVSFEACNSGGCSTDYITIVVGTGTIADAGLDQNLCGTTTSTFAGNDPAPDPGNWALLTGSGTPTTPTAFNSGVTGLGIGLNQFTWTITGSGCTSVDTVDINVTAGPNAGTDNTLGICTTGNPIDLHGLLGGADTTGTWSGPSVLTGGYLGTFDPSTATAGTYEYIIIGSAPCPNDTAEVVVTITANDDPTFTYPDFCSDSTGIVGVVNTPGGTFSFNPDPLDGSAINATTGDITNGVAGSTYDIQYLTPAGPCQDSLTISVNVLNCIVYTAGFTTSNTIICAGDSIIFTDTSTAGTNGWQWNFDLTTVGGVAPATAATQGAHTVFYNNPGTFTVQLIATDGTDIDTATATITVTASDDPTFTYPDFCAGTTGVVGSVNTPGGTFSFNPDPLDGSAINAATGDITNGVAGSTYDIQYLTPAGSCQDSLTISVNVLNCVVYTAGFTTSNTSICAGDSIIFTDTSTVGTTIWQWDFDATAVGGATPSTSSAQGPHTVTYNTPGTYNVELIVSDGTEIDTATAVITVTDCSPTANFTASQTTLCESDCITFTDMSTGSPTSYVWSFSGGTPNNATGSNPGSICYNTAGTYNVTLTVTNQYGVDSLVMTNLITVNSCPAPTAGIDMDDADGEICESGCIDFVYNQGTGGVPTTIDWTFPGGTPSTYSSTDPTETINVCWNDTTGTFAVDVVATNPNGTSNATTNVVVHLAPIVDAGLDTLITIGSDGYLHAVVTDTAGNVITGGSFSWTPPSNLTCPNCPNSVVNEPLETNTYIVTYTDQYGCVVSDAVEIAVEIATNIGVPSGFSPNGDGSNDVLLVRGKVVIETMVFTVYNRYGQKVFETTNVDEGWDGTHNGSEVNPGVFTYFVNATFIDGSTGQLKGNVTLVR